VLVLCRVNFVVLPMRFVESILLFCLLKRVYLNFLQSSFSLRLFLELLDTSGVECYVMQ